MENQVSPFAMDRLESAERLTGKKRSLIYVEMGDGLFPPAVKIGERSVAWPRHELEALNAARAAGLPDAEIRALVQRLVADRAKRFLKLTGHLDGATRQAA